MSVHMLVLVLTHKENMNKVIKEFAENDIHGATVIDSTGMASVINSEDFEDEEDYYRICHAVLNHHNYKLNRFVYT